MTALYIILGIIGVIVVAGIISLIVEIKNAAPIDPNEPFLDGEERSS